MEAGECEADWLEMHIGDGDEGLDEERFRKVAVLSHSDRAKIHRNEGHPFRKRTVASIVDRFMGITIDR